MKYDTRRITENSLILIDGSFYLYRAYHIFPLMTNSSGEPTGAIYGVLNMLKSLLIKYRPSHVVVVFDAIGKTFRNELFDRYKSHRLPMPNNLRSQISPLYKMIEAIGLPLIAISGVEADDVIGTLAIAAELDGHDVLISTGDKDMAQLVSPKITLINTMSNTTLDPQEVQFKFGVPPELIIDYLALIGDSSDNIPGVPGIGKKTAQALLQEFRGIKNIYQQLDNINTLNIRGAKTIATKLKKYREIAFLSYQLASIKTDVKLDLSYNQLTIKKTDIEALMLLFQRYEFKHWLSDIEIGKWVYNHNNIMLPSFSTIFSSDPSMSMNKPKAKVKTKILSKNDCQIIYDLTTLKQWITDIRSSSIFAFKTETDRLNTLIANLVGLYFAIKPGKVAYLPVKHNCLNTPKQLDLTSVLTLLKPVLEDDAIGKIGHNFKFHYGVLKRYNIELAGIAFDTMLESYVLDSVAGRHDIASLADRFLQYTTVNLEDTIDKKRNQITFNQIASEYAAPYAAKETDVTLRLHNTLWPRIMQVPELQKVFQKIEMPLVPVLARIERAGVLINKNILDTHSVELTKRLKALKLKAYQLAEEPFNLSSTKDIQKILYSKYKMPVLKNTPRGVPSTSEEVLAELAINYPLPKLILEYRGLAKLKSTYTDKLLQMINPISKRIHTSYHQAVTATGRLSSSDPNLQNIPIRNNEGRRIRQAFIAPSNMLIVVADYSQIELRLMAHLSHDPKLLNAFATGRDVHCTTAAEVFGLPLKKVTEDQRRKAKIINFGLIYGMSAFSLARQLSIPRSEASKYINLYFKQYPGVLDYIERTRRQAINQGYVTTLDGRRIYFPDIQSCNSIRKKGAERAAINAPMQGTAADIIKRAMIAIDSWLQQETPPVRMIMQVHDELVFEVQRDAVESVKSKIKTLMNGSFTLDLPLQVDIGIGENWDQAH